MMENKFKIGDIVILDKEKTAFKSSSSFVFNTDLNNMNNQPKWYSNKIFTIIGFEKEYNTAILNENLKETYDNKINIYYLKLLKTERKNKISKINLINLKLY